MYSRAHVKVKSRPGAVRCSAHDRTHETLSLRRTVPPTCIDRAAFAHRAAEGGRRSRCPAFHVIAIYVAAGARARTLSLRLWRLGRNWRRSRQRIINSFMYAERERRVIRSSLFIVSAIRALRARETNALPSK